MINAARFALTDGPAEVCAADVTGQIASTIVVAIARTLKRSSKHINKPGASITIIEMSAVRWHEVANDLTINQEKYVQELLKGKTQRKAYWSAYPHSKKWKHSSVDSQACRLLKKPKVKARFDELKAKLISLTEEKAIVTAEKILEEIAGIAFDDIGNYLEYKTVKTVVDYDDETGEPIIGYQTVVELNDSKHVDTKNISEISIAPNGTLKTKMYERDKALYKLAEILGLDEISKARQKLAEDKFEHDKDIDNKKVW